MNENLVHWTPFGRGRCWDRTWGDASPKRWFGAVDMSLGAKQLIGVRSR